jgi:ABC-type nitrate/sulfonate/bicarbonate transport system substrate-binding protein
MLEELSRAKQPVELTDLAASNLDERKERFRGIFAIPSFFLREITCFRGALNSMETFLSRQTIFLVAFCLSLVMINGGGYVLAQATSKPDRPLQKITISYPAVSMTWLPIRVAVDKGFFADEGVEPSLILMRGNLATVALANGDIDFALNITIALQGALQGLGLKLVAALNTRPLFSLVVRPEIKSVGDLKGKVLAVNAFGFSQAILTEMHLQHLGLKKDEYKLIAAGGTEGRLAAMEKNLAQGTLVPPPVNVKMENQGYRLIGNTADVIVYPIIGLVTQENKIKSHPEIVEKVLRAALRGLSFVRANRADTIKVIMSWVKLNEKDAMRAYDLSKEGFSRNGNASDEDLSNEWNILKEATKKTNVSVASARDFTILRKVQKDLGIQ